MAQYAPQVTLQYTLFIKRNISEALQDAFTGHPDPTVANAFVGVDFQHRRFKLPAIIIKFYERQLPNAGVGHIEWLPSPDDPDPDNPTQFIKYFHRMYQGDIAFDIWGESSVDRDLIRDALIEILAMQDTTTGGSNFLQRLYHDMQQTPYGVWHFPVLNLDLITGYGEQASLAPWQPEDLLVYKASYRVPIFGEFYSITPSSPAAIGPVQEVDVYPWIEGTDPDPTANPDGPGAHGWWQFTEDNRVPTVAKTGTLELAGSLRVLHTRVGTRGNLEFSGALGSVKSGP